MKKILTVILFLLILTDLYSFSKEINGNNIIWSPVSDIQFLYSVYGKSSGKTMWRVYDTEQDQGNTIHYGNSLVPKWSYDGKKIVFTDKNMILIYSDDQKVQKYSTSVDDLVSFDWSLKEDKITYSDGEKIYILELSKKNNYLVINGESPLFIDNDKQIIYFDRNSRVNIVDESLKSRVLLTNIIQKIFSLKNQNSFIFQDDNTIKLYDISHSVIYTLVQDENEIDSLNISYDFEFLTYSDNIGEHFVVHIPTMMKVSVLKNKDFFAQRLSMNNKYSAFEKNGMIQVKDVKSYISAFNLKNIFKISMGSSDGIKIGSLLEVYQEKKNPFTGKQIGYEEQCYKGALKVIAVYEDYCFASPDKDFTGNKTIEVGDAVLWKGKNKLGNILDSK